MDPPTSSSTSEACNPSQYNFTSDMNYSCIYGSEHIILARYIDFSIMILSIVLLCYCIKLNYKKISMIQKYDEYTGIDGKKQTYCVFTLVQMQMVKWMSFLLVLHYVLRAYIDWLGDEFIKTYISKDQLCNPDENGHYLELYMDNTWLRNTYGFTEFLVDILFEFI